MQEIQFDYFRGMEAEQYSQTAAEDLSQIETNSLTISALDGAEGGEDPVAETLIAEITATLSDYAQAAKIAGQEYSETKLNQCISASVSGFSLLSVLLLCVGGAVAFYLAVSLLGAAHGDGGTTGTKCQADDTNQNLHANSLRKRYP